MERRITIKEAKEIMGQNFIGPEELLKMSKDFNIQIVEKNIPEIIFSKEYIKKIKKDYILILGIPKDKKGGPLTINNMAKIFGYNSSKQEPCFYNQDWYLNENFAKEKTLELKWYLIKKNINKETRGKQPEKISQNIHKKERFPSAVLATFVFFAFYLHTGKILWENDFIWCKDKDSNGDRVYVGRYKDRKKINKNGFNVHRYLTIKSCYGFAPEII